MRIPLAASLIALSLAACSPAPETLVVAESPAADTAVTPVPKRDSCKDITALAAARADLDGCLPKDWSSRDGSQPDPKATEVMIYESAADAKRSMDASAYLYPVELRKEWSEGGRADPPGWRVTLSFQQEANATSAPDQQ